MSKLKDDIYQRMHGFKSIQRGYVRNGQSEWRDIKNNLKMLFFIEAAKFS